MNTTTQEVKIFEFNPINEDDDCNDLFSEMETYIDEMDVDSTVENDGIGHYEYWGAPGFDAGTDYIEIEDYEAIQIKVTGLDSDEARQEFAKIIIDDMPNKTLSHGDEESPHGGYIEEDFKLVMENKKNENGVFTADLVWESNN